MDTNANEAEITLDYIKFLIPLDADRVQQFGAWINAQASDPSTGIIFGTNARFKIEASAGFMPDLCNKAKSGRWENNTRCDWRSVIARMMFL